MKEKAISSNIVWKVTGKPHSGSISQQRKSDKLAYKIKIREGKENELFSYSKSIIRKMKVVNSGNVGKQNSGVPKIVYHVRLMV